MTMRWRSVWGPCRRHTQATMGPPHRRRLQQPAAVVVVMAAQRSLLAAAAALAGGADAGVVAVAGVGVVQPLPRGRDVDGVVVAL